MSHDGPRDRRLGWGWNALRPARRRDRHRLRPALLALEDRRLPSTFTVTSIADTETIGSPTTGTLRWAVEQADNANSPSTITFNLGSTPQTITLIQGVLALSNTSESIAIDGPAAGVTISGGGKSGVFLVDSLATASLSLLTIEDGSAPDGAGVFNQGTATIADSTFSGNSAPNGGGLFNQGTVTIADSTFSGNSSIQGGGLENWGTATISASTIYGNTATTGGGLVNAARTVALTDTIVAGNVTGGADTASDIGGPAAHSVTGSFNLIGTGGAGGISNGSPGNIVLTSLADLGLANLGSYGGPTQTLGLLPGSPAIGRGTAIAGIAADQHGMPIGTTVDIGAFQASLIVNSQSAEIDTNASAMTFGGAVSLANQFAGSAITFAPTISAGSTIDLGFVWVNFSNTALTTTIVGPVGKSNLVLENGLFRMDVSAVVTLSNLSITSTSIIGLTEVVNHGTLTLNNCSITNGYGNLGGGLRNTGTATLNDCTIASNFAPIGSGGIYNIGTISLNGCTIDSNGYSFATGGGIYNAGKATLSNCAIFSNDAVSGGGVFNTGNAILIDCAIYANTAIYANGEGGQGGGVFNSGTAALINCTISGDQATTGGGVFNSAKVVPPPSPMNFNNPRYSYITYSSEHPGLYGTYYSGGLGNTSPDVRLSACTISGNSASSGGGGVYNGSIASLTDTIVAGNDDGDIDGGAPVTGSFNLIGTGGSDGITQGSGDTNNIILSSLDGLDLGVLADYGGPTETVMLLPGSAAIGEGTAIAGVTTDQRGYPLDSPAPDIGAFQLESISLVVNVTTDVGGMGTRPGQVDLRDAVDTASALGGPQTITFDPVAFASPQTIALDGAPLVLADQSAAIAIDAPAAGVTISGGGDSGVFVVDEDAYAVLSGLTITGGSGGQYGAVRNSGTVTLYDCTISGNSSGEDSGPSYSDCGGLENSGTATIADCTFSGNSGFDGGIKNSGTATLTDCTFSGNSGGGAAVANSGTIALTNCSISGNDNSLGMFNQGTATLNNCTISENQDGGFGEQSGEATLINCSIVGNTSNFSQDTSSFNGSGVAVAGGTVDLTDDTITGNTSSANGGGVSDEEGTIDLTDCTISGNTASGNGGGVSQGAGGNLEMSYSTIDQNSARSGGGVAIGGEATIEYCTISDNSASIGGGGVQSTGSTTLTDCTISGNTADTYGGGLVATAGTLNLTDDTIIGNAAGWQAQVTRYDFGGAIATDDVNLTISACTITGNSAPQAGGIYDFSADPTLTDTIVAGNTSNTPATSDIGGNSNIASSSSYNLFGTGGSGGIVNGPQGNIVLASLTGLDLAPLADYGGPTETIALLPGSPAIGKGTPVAGITTDQRGFPRDLPNPDIGAFQVSPLVVNTTIGGVAPISGQLSLQQAVDLANSLGGAQTITFDPSVFAAPQTIALTQGPLALADTTGTITIDGPAAGVTINGGGKSGVFLIDQGVTAALSGLTIAGGNAASGGGVDNSGTLTISDCTIGGNTALAGGGVCNYGTATIADSTIAGNSGGDAGGGVYNFGTLTLNDCTISGNSATDGGGVYNVADTNSRIFLIGSIVAANAGGDVGGTNISGAYNLIGTGDHGGTNYGGLSASDPNLLGIHDPLLAPLGNYGGPTQTMPLLPGSPAIAAGTPIVGITTDQRGIARPSTDPDIGASQSQGFTLTIVAGSSAQTTAVGTAFAKPMAVIVKAVNRLDPVTGGVITFSDPSIGASAILSGETAIIGANGQASVTATANATAGDYRVTASTRGAGSNIFALINRPAAAISGLTVGWGTSGSAAMVLPDTPDGLLLPAGRKTDLPWLGIDRITLTLNQADTFTSSDVTITSAIGANYGPITVTESGTTVTIELGTPIATADRVTIAIGGPGIAGFIGQLAILPGDANDDGAVNSQDLVAEQQQWLGIVTPTIFGDITGDGTPTEADYLAVRQRIGTKLPPAGS